MIKSDKLIKLNKKVQRMINVQETNLPYYIHCNIFVSRCVDVENHVIRFLFMIVFKNVKCTLECTIVQKIKKFSLVLILINVFELYIIIILILVSWASQKFSNVKFFIYIFFLNKIL